MCEGESLRYGQNGVGQADHIRRAAATLGVCDVRPLGFPDQRLDTMPLTDLIMPLDAIVKEVRYDGWSATQKGDRIVRISIRKVLQKYRLPASGDLFDHAYAYIAEH